MITLNLTKDQIQTIINALLETPWKTANPVLAELDRQLKVDSGTVS